MGEGEEPQTPGVTLPTQPQANKAAVNAVVNEHKTGMINTEEQRWKDYELLIMVRNMLSSVERQYNDLHGELGQCLTSLTKASKKRKDKSYEEVESMQYKSKKIMFLLK